MDDNISGLLDKILDIKKLYLSVENILNKQIKMCKKVIRNKIVLKIKFFLINKTLQDKNSSNITINQDIINID